MRRWACGGGRARKGCDRVKGEGALLGLLGIFGRKLAVARHLHVVVVVAAHDVAHLPKDAARGTGGEDEPAATAQEARRRGETDHQAKGKA